MYVQNHKWLFVLFMVFCLFTMASSIGWCDISSATDDISIWNLSHNNGTITETWGITRDRYERWQPVEIETVKYNQMIYRWTIPAATPLFSHSSGSVIAATTVLSVSEFWTEPIPIDGSESFSIQILTAEGVANGGGTPQITPFTSVWPIDEGFYTDHHPDYGEPAATLAAVGSWNVLNATGFYYNVHPQTVGGATAANFQGFKHLSFMTGAASLMCISGNIQAQLQAGAPTYLPAATWELLVTVKYPK